MSTMNHELKYPLFLTVPRLYILLFLLPHLLRHASSTFFLVSVLFCVFFHKL